MTLPPEVGRRTLTPLRWLVACLLLTLAPVSGFAATRTVTSTGDSASDATTLRGAIAAASAGDTINFNLPVPSTITLTQGVIEVDRNLTIQGPGANAVTVSGNNSFTVFLIDSGRTVAISGLSMTQGHSANDGGGIYSYGTLTLTGCAIFGNMAGNGAGGGIYSFGPLTLTNCAVYGNTTHEGAGGGVCSGGSLAMTNCTVFGNTAGDGAGGGVYGADALTLTNCTVFGNTAPNGGLGGGVYNDGILTMTSTIDAGNDAPNVISYNTTPTSGGSNIIGDADGNGFTNGVNHDQTGVSSPGLDTQMRDNSSTNGVPTVALLPGSPAILADYAARLGLDGRGRLRPQGRADSGAYEYTLTLSGNPSAWGWNIYGQLGSGTNSGINTANPAPLQVSGLTGVVGVAGMPYHSLALKSDGTIWAWGRNTSGQLGNGTNVGNSNPNPTPVIVDGITGVVAVAGGFGHSLALRSDGTVWAWGQNNYGQLGNGSLGSTNVLTPTRVSGLSNVVAIAGGYYQSYVLKSDGTVWAWGLNSNGQLGNGTTTTSATPVQVSGLAGVVALAAGQYHSLALRSDGTVWAWGQNNYGQIGNGTSGSTNVLTPVQVSGLSGVVAVAGGAYHSLALRSDGTVWAWGQNTFGQLGNGTTATSTVPVQVSGLSGVVAVAGGFGHSLALKSDGSVWAWGQNNYGQLGNGTTSSSFVPVGVNGSGNVLSISSGYYHNLVCLAVAPVAVNDSYTASKSTTLTADGQGGHPAGVLANDTYTPGSVSAMLVAGPAHGTLTLSPDGTFTYTPTAGYYGADSFTYQVQDSNGTSNVATVSLTLTDAAPTTTAAVNPASPNGLAGWYKTSVNVTLTPSDPDDAASTLTTKYTTDGSDPTVSATATTVPGAGPVVLPLTGDGQYAVKFYSVDSSNAAEAVQTVLVKIDGTNPTLVFGAPSPAPNAAGWYNGPVDVPYTASDATSGVDTPGTNGTVTVGTEGPAQTQSLTVTDVAGNDLSFSTPAFKIDLTDPVTTDQESGTQAPNGDYTGAPTVTLSATDTLSGVAATYYSIDFGPDQPYTGPFTVPGDGQHTVLYHSVDNADNMESYEGFQITTDATAPTTTASLAGPQGGNGWYTGDVTVTLNAADAVSSVASTVYSVDGGASQPYTAPFTVSGDGTHTVKFHSVDSDGNVEQDETQTVKIDGTDPVVTFSAPSPAPNAAGWNTTDVSIPYTATDATSGVDTATPGSPVIVSIESAGLVQTVTATDVAGNTVQGTTPVVRIDKTKPVTLASSQSTAGGEQVTLSATDTLSGVAGTAYSVDGGTELPYTAPFTVGSNGTHTVTFHSVDNAGNVEDDGTITFTVNLPAPITTISLSGPQGSSGWYTGDVTVTLTAQAGALAVATTCYSVDGGAAQVYSAPFTVSGDAVHTVLYWSVDTAGNEEAHNQQPVQIDATAPTLVFDAPSPAPNAAGWNNTPVSIGYTGSDATSGFAGATPGSPVQFSAEGHAQTQSVTALDVAGNSASFPTPAVNIDETAPVTTATPAGTRHGTGTYTGVVTVTLGATDGLSGVASTAYSVDGGAELPYTAPFTLSGDGVHTVTFHSVDNAGNIEADKTLTVSVDATAPTTTASLAGPQGDNGWYTGPVTVTLGSADGASTAYSVDGGAELPYTAPFTVSGDAVHTVTFHSVDAAGNAEADQTLAVKIDGTAPALTTGTPSPTPNAAGWNNTPVTVTVTGADATSGFAGTTPAGPFTFSAAGKGQTKAFTGKDNAGNTASGATPKVSIDLDAPATTATPSGATNSAGSYTTSATVTLSASDDLSGVAGTTYAIDSDTTLPYTGPFTVSGTGTHKVTFFSTDVAGNAEAPKTLSVTVAAPALPAATVLHTFPAGLQMIAVTESYGSASVALSPAPSKLAIWGPSLVQYTLLGGSASLSPGLGYWVRFGQATDLLDKGTLAPNGEAFTVSLQKGWNMIGDPFPSAVSLSGVSVRSSAGKSYTFKTANLIGLVQATLYSYPAGSTAYQTMGADGSLAPYTGYWIYAFQSCSLSVPAPR